MEMPKIWEKCGIMSCFFILFPFWLSTTLIPWGLVRFKSCKDKLDAEQWCSCLDQEVASCLCLSSFSTPHWFPLEHKAVDFNILSVTIQPVPYPLSHHPSNSCFSVEIKMLCGSVSNALHRSRQIMSVALPSSPAL